jgi:hypothetical protein
VTAQQKQAHKLGLPLNTAVNVLPSLEDEKSVAKQKPPGLRGIEESQTPSGGTFPEVPSPGLQVGAGGLNSASAGTLFDKDGNAQKVTYAIAIYPYV